MIRFEEVSFSHRGKRRATVLDRVSFALDEGTLATVVGPTGSGKSTLLRIAAGVLSPSGGKVTVGGRRLTLLGARERARLRGGSIGFLSQTPALVPFLTTLENVLLPTMTTPVAAPRTRAESLLTDLGMGHRGRHRPTELSAGERQRCALAQVLLMRPKVILADHPAAHQDAEGARLVLDLLVACQQEGATVLIASPTPLEALRASRRFTLQQGLLGE